MLRENVNDCKQALLHNLIQEYRLDKDLIVHVYVSDMETKEKLSERFRDEKYIKDRKLKIFLDKLTAYGYEHADLGIIYEPQKMKYANEWRMDGMITVEIR